jgi:phage tail protein X
MKEIVTLPGEVVDQVCRRAYGQEAGHVEAVLAANPGLASRPKRLPAGLVILLPELPAAAPTDPVVKLWD